MLRIIPFAICIVLVLLFLAGTGSNAMYACSCDGTISSEKNCCQSHCDEHFCPHSPTKVPNGIAEAAPGENCYCGTASELPRTGIYEVEPEIGMKLVAGEHLPQSPVIFPIKKRHHTPIWLKPLFYPDKSNLYLNSQHLLL